MNPVADESYAAPVPIRFVIAGGIAALANFGSRIAFSLVLGYALAIVCAYLLGMAVAFVLNRRYVFPPGSNPLAAQIAWFVVFNALALAQTLVVSLLLARYALPALGWDWYAHEIAHAVGVAVPIVTSYFGHKHVTFR
jgi:putative flippase GtrA